MNFAHARQTGVIGPSQTARTGSTLRLHLLMEAAQRLEIAERITQLRERSPYTQPVIADELGIRLRSYQKLEKVGTTKFERCEQLAKIHAKWTARSEEWQHVSAEWIWDGAGSREGSPLEDLSRAEGEAHELSGAVDALRAEVAQLRSEAKATRTKLLSEIAKVQKAPASQRTKPPRRAQGS